MNHVRAVCRGTRYGAVHILEQELDQYTEEDGKFDIVNIRFSNSNSKRPCIIAKLKTNSYQISMKNILLNRHRQY